MDHEHLQLLRDLEESASINSYQNGFWDGQLTFALGGLGCAFGLLGGFISVCAGGTALDTLIGASALGIIGAVLGYALSHSPEKGIAGNVNEMGKLITSLSESRPGLQKLYAKLREKIISAIDVLEENVLRSGPNSVVASTLKAHTDQIPFFLEAVEASAAKLRDKKSQDLAQQKTTNLPGHQSAVDGQLRILQGQIDRLIEIQSLVTLYRVQSSVNADNVPMLAAMITRMMTDLADKQNALAEVAALEGNA